MRFLRRWRPLVLLVASWLLFMYYLYRDDINSTTNNNDHMPTPPEEPQPPKTPGKPRPATGHHDIPDVEDIFKNGPAESGGEIGADHWWKLPRRFPVANPRPLPRITAQRNGGKQIPKVQAVPPAESQAARGLRLQRQTAVRNSFVHSWSGYKRYAWMSDEVKPLTGNFNNPFGGWAATLVDALDSLWIMGLTGEFEEAVRAAETIDFTRTTADRINVFETTIRYMGGFLSAYELSGKKYESLLQKAREVGELLMCAFDTENHMPIARWDWKFYMTGHAQSPTKDVLLSELGSLTLEFTKLSQLTGDASYYDAVQRISDLLENEQFETKLPGLWPVTIDMKNKRMPDFYHEGYFSLGGMADSLYEYFPKQYLLLGGALEQPRALYSNFLETAKLKLLKRVSNPDNRPIVMSGDVKVKETNWGSLKEEYINKAQHLTCFAGGMVALAAKVFDRPDDELELAAQLTDGCIWAYESLPTGLMPELFRFAPCGDINETQTGASCAWDEQAWRTQVRDYHAGSNPEKRKWDPMGAEITTLIEKKNLVPGFLEMLDKKYILRPEAIESVFIMYRLTGEAQWMDKAWRMFETIEALTRTEVAAAGVREVTVDVSTGTTVDHLDTMESFWLAETLKYFYLVFSEWDLVDLDVWVLNTEAHPLQRMDVAW